MDRLITEDFFAHKGININNKTGLAKARAFLKKATWEDMLAMCHEWLGMTQEKNQKKQKQWK